MVPIKFYATLIGVLLMMIALLGGGWYAYHAGDKHGADRVHAQWDASKVSQANAAVKAATKNAATEHAQSTAFVGIESNYIEANNHAPPSLSIDLPGDLAAGTVQLRDSPVYPAGGGVSEATVRSRTADAAATQALADRVANSVAAVRAGDEADKREQQLRNQVIALQAILTEERATQP